jgi:PAS domain S-box-containing protein
MISLLYVDDEPALLELVKNVLEDSAEFSVDTKSSVQDALAALSSRQYDAIVADYFMPEIDGIAFLQQVRKQYGDIPFILLTGRGQEEVVIKALNNGADFYLQKGGDFQIVFTELNHILKQCIRIRKTKKNLLEREERYHDLQNANDLIQSVAPDGHFLFANKKWLDTLGYKEEGLESITIFDIIHQESLDHCKTTFQRVISGENVGIIDAIFKTRDGNKVYVEGIATCRMRDGKPQYTRGIFKDVTDRKIAEAALRESEERYRALVETSRDMLWEVSKDERYTYVSPQVLEILGYQPEEVIGKTCYDLMPSDEVERIREKFNQIASTGKPIVRLENINLHKDGRLVILETSGDPIRASDGTIVGYRGIDSDITERKRAEEALRQSENYLKTLLESIPAGVIVVDAKMHTIISANPSALALFGASGESVLGKICHNFICPAANGHCPISDKGMHIDRSERVLLNASGVPIPIIKSVSCANLNGQEVLIETFVDISEWKKAESALLESEQKFRSLVEHALDGILILDLQGTILFTNNAAARTIESDAPAGFVGRNVIEFIAPESRQDVITDFIQVSQGHDAYLAQYNIISAKGNKFWVESIGKVINFNKTPAILLSIRDITERKRAEDALRQANKQINLLSSITRHDILNQLMVLKGYLGLSQGVIDKPEILSGYIKKEQLAANAIQNQITFTRDYQVLGVAAPTWQNVNASIQKALAILPVQKIPVYVDRTDLEIFADPLFEKVFYNLIDNALRYGGDQLKTIRISSQESDGHLTLVCEDDGVGISSEDKKRLFTRGFGKNTGLGLFLSREILAITGITITENGIPDKGARFEITVTNGAYRFASNR